MYSGPTVTNDGTQLAAYKLGSGRSVGGTERSDSEIILKANTKYAMKIVNDTNSNNWFAYLIDWYEHINLN